MNNTKHKPLKFIYFKSKRNKMLENIKEQRFGIWMSIS